jgi:hypothetical protein
MDQTNGRFVIRNPAIIKAFKIPSILQNPVEKLFLPSNLNTILWVKLLLVSLQKP